MYYTEMNFELAHQDQFENILEPDSNQFKSFDLDALFLGTDDKNTEEQSAKKIEQLNKDKWEERDEEFAYEFDFVYFGLSMQDDENNILEKKDQIQQVDKASEFALKKKKISKKKKQQKKSQN